jgi:hypothetical protein
MAKAKSAAAAADNSAIPPTVPDRRAARRADPESDVTKGRAIHQSARPFCVWRKKEKVMAVSLSRVARADTARSSPASSESSPE